ncbi:30S ribosomal protein S8, partial [Striga asiatica]
MFSTDYYSTIRGVDKLLWMSICQVVPLNRNQSQQANRLPIGGYQVHDQVLITSWVVVAILLSSATIVVRNSQSISTGGQNFFEYVLIITSIQNADMDRKRVVRIAFTNITENIVKILFREGFIENVRKHLEKNKSF